MDNNEYIALNKLLKAANDKAVEDTFRLGLPITIVENGWIVKKYSNGSIIRIKRIKPRIEVKKRIYKLDH